jgi:hypothetical protein
MEHLLSRTEADALGANLQRTNVTACALPVDGTSLPTIPYARFDFVLVPSREIYETVSGLGGQPILTPLRFSVTDTRGRLRLLLGGLLEPWRWRRVLLNEGITSLVVYKGRRSWVFTVAARLARTRVSAPTPQVDD